MKKIGFIGIGLMGLPMAKNLLKAGYNLKAFNRSQKKAEALKEFGAEIVTSIDDVVNNSDVVITMLTDDTAINEVMESSNFLENLKSGATVIDMSSVKPTTATKHEDNLKSKNINYLDAPDGPTKVGFPIVLKISITSSKTFCSPPTLIANEASSAPIVPPDTGASK